MCECCDRQAGSWGLPPEQLWIDRLCLQSTFFQGLSYLRVLILMYFLWTMTQQWRNGLQEGMALTGMYSLWMSAVSREGFVHKTFPWTSSKASA